jgi:hypothetical protein
MSSLRLAISSVLETCWHRIAVDLPLDDFALNAKYFLKAGNDGQVNQYPGHPILACYGRYSRASLELINDMCSARSWHLGQPFRQSRDGLYRSLSLRQRLYRSYRAALVDRTFVPYALICRLQWQSTEASYRKEDCFLVRITTSGSWQLTCQEI